MKRSAITAKGWPYPPRPAKTISDDYTLRPRETAVSISDGKARMVMQVPKTEYLRDETYRRWVADQPCAHCGIEGWSQAAHSDDNGAAGKGLQIKASDDSCYPACGPRPGEPGCHWRLGSSGAWTKEQRHRLEAGYSARTWASWMALKQGI